MNTADQLGDEAFTPSSVLHGLQPQRERHVKVKVGLYTYGSPRCGNWSFSHLLDRVVPNSFRVGKYPAPPSLR
jgi:hypothetical protein